MSWPFSTRRSTALLVVFTLASLPLRSLPAQTASIAVPKSPRAESVVMVDPQPHESDPAVIWYDDLDDDQTQQRYGEKSGELTAAERFGDTGKSLPMRYPKGQRGSGGRKVFFGDSPAHRGAAVRTSESFDDIYWRIYVKHPHHWTGGGPAKLSRATSLVPPGWRQAMIAHVWSSDEALTLDPASGVDNDRVVTTRYNDFPHLKWLGNRPRSQFKLHGDDGAGWWVCVEARAKLNTPGKQNGLNQLWIDGRLEAERRDLDWRGRFDDYGINAVFLEAYWNAGSPVDQSRWIDNFVISTEPIGPVVCPRNPTVLKTPYRGVGKLRDWEMEVSADADGSPLVWKSKPCTDARRMTVNAENGDFCGPLEGSTRLDPQRVYYVRLRHRGEAGPWSDWSPWHQPFSTL